MKKVKFLIASLFCVMAFVFSCVLNTEVKAAENENSYFYSTKTVASSSTKWETLAEGTQLGNSIFSVICTAKGKVQYKPVGSTGYPNSVSDYSSGLSIPSASSTGTNPDYCIKVVCPEAGKLKDSIVVITRVNTASIYGVIMPARYINAKAVMTIALAR